jgi:hypothetical protein
MAVAVPPDRVQQGLGGLVERGGLDRLQPLQVRRRLAPHRLRHAARRHLPDPFQPHQLPGTDEPRDLVRIAAAQDAGRGAERPDPVGRLVRALQQESDAAQVRHGIPALGHARDGRTAVFFCLRSWLP